MNAITHVEAAAVAVIPQAASPVAMMLQALQQGVTIEQMQGVLAVQKEWEANEARKAYVAAIADFKRNPPEIFKLKTVAFGDTMYRHATLGAVTDAISIGLAEHGFSHRWDTKQESGKITVTCVLTHKLGHSESTEMSGTPDASGKKNPIQQIASAVTYFQRYTLLSLSGIATKDVPPDDDGAGGDGNDDDTAGGAAPATAAEPLPYPQDQFDKNLPGWSDVIAAGRKTVAQLTSMVQTKSGQQFTAAQIKKLSQVTVKPAEGVAA